MKSIVLFQKVSTVDKVFFFQNIEIMIRAGFSLSDALNVVAEQTKNKKFKEVIAELKIFIEGGGTFSKGLGRYPKIFPEILANMVAAGEISGKLEKTLHQITLQLKRSHTLHNKIRNALTYPVIILFAMVVVGILMMIFVIPKILMVYEGTSFQLPLPTRIILWISRFISQEWMFVVAGSVIVIGAFAYALSKEKGKYALYWVLGRLPIIKRILQEISLARMARILNSLITTDIPIVESFEILSQTLGNRLYRTYLKGAAEELKKGESIYKIFKTRPDLFPPVVAAMIKVAEESGNLEFITGQITDFYEEEVTSTMDNLSVLIEPILMMIIGAGVAVMATAIIMPIYGLVNQI